MRTFIETLTPKQISHIIPILEQGLELEKVKYLATKDPSARPRIADSCVFLSSLRVRQLFIRRGGDPDHIG